MIKLPKCFFHLFSRNILKPPGISRDDGKGRASLIPWNQGKSLLFDVTLLHYNSKSNVAPTNDIFNDAKTNR